MQLGYNTNGFANHDPLAAIDVLAEIGYRSVALTVDHACLSPLADWRSQIEQIKERLDAAGMRCVIETGARYLLNPRVKHEPTLVSPLAADRAARREFLKHCINLAAELRADCVSLWSGAVRDDAGPDEVWERLIPALHAVAEIAASQGVVLGFEPEPGMFVDTMTRYAELSERISHPAVQLTLDVGHLHCLGEVPIAGMIARCADQIINVHIEDMRAGVHDHLLFGDGEMDFPPIIRALAAANYAGGVHVELSRHSHAAPQVAQVAFEFLRPLFLATQSHGGSA